MKKERNKTQDRQRMQMKKPQLLTTNRPMPSQPLSSNPPANFPPGLCAEDDILWYGTSLWSAVPAVPPPSFLCTRSLLAGGAV